MQLFAIHVSSIAMAVALAGGVSSQALAQDTTPASTTAGQVQSPPVKQTKKPAKKPAKVADVADESDHATNTIEVTGSRLQQGDPTAQVTVITAEDIKARGVTSVEELMRTIPQNQATIGAITNERSRGPLSSAQRGAAAVSTLGSLGVSAANLGGSGAGNTLVLVNGRRMAGAAGIEDGFVNLNGIPLSAVDHVEIDTSGSAAIYGSDAIGGVINFILKKHYTGTTLSTQHEFSANEASSTRLSAASGYAWGSGSISGTLSYDHRNPINNYKSGYTTQNYSSYYGGDPQYDLRSWYRGYQPGVIVFYDPNQSYAEVGLSPRSGVTGVPTPSDFIVLDPSLKRDYVPKYAGPKSDSISATLNFEQEITDNLSIFANGLFNHTKSTQNQDYYTGLQIPIAPGQYYNSFPAYYFSFYSPSTDVSYFPALELANGDIPPSVATSTSDAWAINAGLTYKFNEHTKLEFVFTTSTSKSSSHSTKLGSLVNSIIDNGDGTYSCYNFQLANNTYTGDVAAAMAAFNKQCAALTSTDPTVAFNPWRTSATDPGGSVTDFLYTDAQEQRQSQAKNYELRLTGNLINLPAGPVSYAVGGDYNDDGVNSREVNVFTGQAVSRTRYAFFGEVSIPILGGNFSLPLLRELTVNIAARNDTYKTDGAIGTVDGIPIDQGGEIIFGHNRFSRTTPSFGIRWAPIHQLVFRGKWSSGFRVPPYSQLFNVQGASSYSTYIFNDPLYDCTAHGDCSRWIAGAYQVPKSYAPNPDLRPQTSRQQSFSATWAPDGFLQGLITTLTYNHTHINNEYATVDRLLALMPAAEVLKISQFYPRDASGKIIKVQNQVFNILGSEYSSINIEAHYRFDTGFGTFTPGINYLRNLKSEVSIFTGTSKISSLGKVNGIDRYKIVGQLGWDCNNFNATLWAYYTPKYINDYYTNMYGGVTSGPVRKVASLTTLDLTGSWRITDTLRANFAGRNILAAKPPLVVIDSRPYDTARYNAAGRTFSIELQKSF